MLLVQIIALFVRLLKHARDVRVGFTDKILLKLKMSLNWRRNAQPVVLTA